MAVGTLRESGVVASDVGERVHWPDKMPQVTVEPNISLGDRMKARLKNVGIAFGKAAVGPLVTIGALAPATAVAAEPAAPAAVEQAIARQSPASSLLLAPEMVTGSQLATSAIVTAEAGSSVQHPDPSEITIVHVPEEGWVAAKKAVRCKGSASKKTKRQQRKAPKRDPKIRCHLNDKLEYSVTSSVSCYPLDGGTTTLTIGMTEKDFANGLSKSKHDNVKTNAKTAIKYAASAHWYIDKGCFAAPVITPTEKPTPTPSPTETQPTPSPEINPIQELKPGDTAVIGGKYLGAPDGTSLHFNGTTKFVFSGPGVVTNGVFSNVTVKVNRETTPETYNVPITITAPDGSISGAYSMTLRVIAQPATPEEYVPSVVSQKIGPSAVAANKGDFDLAS